MDPPVRALRLAAFTISDDRVIAVDDAAPIAVEISIDTGRVEAVHSWPVPPFTGRAIANDVAVVGGAIVVASPAAGGLVFIDRAAGTVTTVSLDAPIGRVVADGTAIWAIADPEWNDDPTRDDLGRRPVVWVEPTAEEVAEHDMQMRGWAGTALVDGAYVVLPAADEPDIDWRNQPDDTDVIRPPTPAWRLEHDIVEPVDFGGELGDVVPFGNRLLAVCRLPSDPVIKRPAPGGGGVGYGYPAAVLLGTPQSGFERVGTVPHLVGAFADGQRVWIIQDDGDDGDALRICYPDEDAGSDPVPLVGEPIAIIGGRIVELDPTARDASGRLRLTPTDGGETTTITIPEVWSENRATSGTEVWFRTVDTSTVVGVDVDTGVVREVRIDIDCRAYIPIDTGAGAQSSITVPVMLDSWELECCQPDAVVGAPWRAFLQLGDAEPWWLEHATGVVPDDVRNFGVIEFEGTVLRPAPSSDVAGLVATGPIRVAATGVGAAEHEFRGVLHHDAHGESDGVLSSENECTGIVRRIQGITFHRERKELDGEPALLPVAQAPPVDLESTARGGFDVYALTIEFGPGATL